MATETWASQEIVFYYWLMVIIDQNELIYEIIASIYDII